MNLELMDDLSNLREVIRSFLDKVDVDHLDESDGEYTFLADESGVSNTELDNFVETLEQASELATQLLTR